MDVHDLTPDQQATYWEVKEWFPHASRAVVISRINQGLDALVAACDDGSIPQDDFDDDKEMAEALRLSMQPELQQQQVLRVLHVGDAAAATVAPLQQRTFQQAVATAAAPPKPAAVAPAVPAATAPPAQQAEAPCTICRQSQDPTASCHWPINKAIGDLKEEDPRAHACCAKCIKTRYAHKRISVTSRVAIACLKKDCEREIHQDRLVADAQLKPALVQWMLGNTDVTVGNARFANTVKELKRKREEEPEITEEERDRFIEIIDRMDHDKFTYLVDLLPNIDFTWLLENIDNGSVFAIIERKEMDDTVPRRKRRRADKKGVTNLVEDRLRLETTFECVICSSDDVPKTLGVPCVGMKGGAGGDGDGSSHAQHLFCGTCIRGHAEAAVQGQESIVRAGLGLRCMQPDCAGVLIYAHIEPLLQGPSREQLEEKIAAEALAAAAVNVERCQRCPFAAIVDLPITQQQTFFCRRCHFEYCRNCNREWSARHVGKTCEELNPEFIRRKVENALSDGAVGVLQRCPGCNIAFEKNGGCNTMHCKCGSNFPYAGEKVMSQQERAAIIRQHAAEAAEDPSVAEELKKIF